MAVMLDYRSVASAFLLVFVRVHLAQIAPKKVQETPVSEAFLLQDGVSSKIPEASNP